MEELYFWGAAVLVGLLLLKLVPASKLSVANKKMRAKIPGPLLVTSYILFFTLIFSATYVICLLCSANNAVRNILTGSIIGAFIGLIPLVDKKHSV